MQIKFYSPLTADFFPNDTEDLDDDYSEYEGIPYTGKELTGYRDVIRDAIYEDVKDFYGDLMRYYREDDSVRRKVVRAVPTVDEVNSELVGSLWVDTDAPLTVEEQAVFCAYISGQYSDGWGEGFEQREICAGDDELYVHLWSVEDDWEIQTEAERFAPRVAEGLPEICFSTLKSTGDLICIRRGESGYYPSDWDTGDKEQNVELADEMNEKLGVSPIQRQAMEVGSMCGWDVPGADPAKYEEDYRPQMGGMTLE